MTPALNPAVSQAASAPKLPLARTLLSWALLSLALLGLRPLLRGLDWWWCSVAIASAAFACALLLRLLLLALPRSIRRPAARAVRALAALPTIAALLGGALVLHLLTAPDALVVGVLPSPELPGVDAELFTAAAQSIRAQHVPAEATPGILFLLGAVTLVFAVLLQFVVVEFGVPLLAAPPVLALLGAPLLLGITELDWWLWLVIAIGLVVLMVEPGRLRWPSLVAAVAVAVASLVLPTVLPTVTAGRALLTGGNGGVGADPVVDLGAQLRSGSTATVLRYTVSGTAEPDYLRLATVSNFSGAVWRPDALSDTSEIREGDALPQAQGTSTTAGAAVVREHIRVMAVGGDRLPLPLAPSAVDGLDGSWRFDAGTSVAVADNASADGQDYTVSSSSVVPTAASLAASDGGVPPGSGTRYLALPSMPASIASTARRVVARAGASGRAAEAEALQNWFRGAFSYSLDTPVSEGFDGDGAAAVAVFLRARSGYCVHFASAMALMARTLGIPSRVVVGYLLGTEQQITGGVSGTVSAQELHAWPELWFDGVGWVRYEPTPQVDSAPSWADAAAATPTAAPSAVASRAPMASPRAAASVTPRSTASAVASRTPTPGALASVGTGGLAGSAWLGLVLVVLALLAAPGLARAAIRASRMRRVRSGGAAAVAVAAAELRASAIDLGLRADPAETLRTTAKRLGGADLAWFAIVAERCVYASSADGDRDQGGGGGSAELAAALETAVRSLREVPGVGRARRVRAAILPRSLRAGRMVAWTPRATGS